MTIFHYAKGLSTRLRSTQNANRLRVRTTKRTNTRGDVYYVTSLGFVSKPKASVRAGSLLRRPMSVQQDPPYIKFNNVVEAARYMVKNSDLRRGRIGHVLDDGSVIVFNTHGRIYLGRKLTKMKVENNNFLYGINSRPLNDDLLVPHRIKKGKFQEKIDGKWVSPVGFMRAGHSPAMWSLHHQSLGISNGFIYDVQEKYMRIIPVFNGRADFSSDSVVKIYWDE